MKTKQDVFELLQEQYAMSRLQETDITKYSYGKRLGISWRQANRVLEKAIGLGLLTKELVLDPEGKRIARYLPAPGWEKKVNGNIFTQIQAQTGLQSEGNSKRAKKKWI